MGYPKLELVVVRENPSKVDDDCGYHHFRTPPLVGGLEHVVFFHILGIIIPID